MTEARFCIFMRVVEALTNGSAATSGDKKAENAANAVAILAEASIFGHGVCNQRMGRDDLSFKKFCDSALVLYFPANIAEVRYGLQQQRNLQRRNAELKLPVTSEHLSLELGTENCCPVSPGRRPSRPGPVIF